MPGLFSRLFRAPHWRCPICRSDRGVDLIQPIGGNPHLLVCECRSCLEIVATFTRDRQCRWELSTAESAASVG